jgi:peroxiredoxin Q/BCP
MIWGRVIGRLGEQEMRTIVKAAVFGMAVLAGASVVVALPQAGDAAPAFRLQDQNYEWHALEDFQGRWLVLYFYPKADTPGCTTEACEFRDNIFSFEEIGAAIVGVSVDEVSSQKEFADKYHLPFPLLSDASKEVAGLYGVLRSDNSVASRQSFIIGPDGRVAKHYAQVDPASHSAEVLADLKSLMGAN